MLVFSDVQSLCISARLWLQVGFPKRLRSDLNQTVSFPPTLFSSSMLRVYFKSILAHTCTKNPLVPLARRPVAFSAGSVILAAVPVGLCRRGIHVNRNAAAGNRAGGVSSQD